MVSGSISPLYPRYFSPFLHSTGSLSVSQEYLALEDGAPRFSQDFSSPNLLRILTIFSSLLIRDYHPLWYAFPSISNSYYEYLQQSYNPKVTVITLVWANTRSLATTCVISFDFFSSAYLDVSVQRVGSLLSVLYLQYNRLSHSDIYESMPACDSS